MQRALRSVVLAILVGGWFAPATGQEGVELGTSLGLTFSLPSEGDNITTFGIPGGTALLNQAGIYASILSSRLMLEPQVALSLISGGGETLTQYSLAGQIGYLGRPEAKGSAYFAAHVGLFGFSGGGSDETSAFVGGGLGYRTMIGEGAALRVEGRYRRYLAESFKLNDLTILVGLGVLLR